MVLLYQNNRIQAQRPASRTDSGKPLAPCLGFVIIDSDNIAGFRIRKMARLQHDIVPPSLADGLRTKQDGPLGSFAWTKDRYAKG